jgi:hypothetical protein
VRLAFDEWGGCLLANAEAEVHAYLDGIVGGAQTPDDARARAEVLRQIIYAGREPFDVPEYYHSRVRDHLGDGRRAARERADVAQPA